MRIRSFYTDDSALRILELELVLWPGLPAIQFVGGADPSLKESAARIKSAIKAAGFHFPVAQQILVNLKPTHIRKSSRGLELAVALAYLWATEQIDMFDLEDVFIYGQLGLLGQVEQPADLLRAIVGENEWVVTGQDVGEAGGAPGFRLRRLENLADLQPDGVGFQKFLAADEAVRLVRPVWEGHEFISEVEARLLELVGVGGHHVLLAGPSGSGKSQLARSFQTVLPELTAREEAELRRSRLDDPDVGPWRPVVEPHHSTPRMAMIGGGSSPRAGEVARAHQGLLILDEMLEFDADVLESLRGPFETGELRVGRLTGVKTFPMDCVIVGTTNLCPCGNLVPGVRNSLRCRFSAKRCRSYGERLSGPLLDRFQILHYPPVKAPERRVELQSVRGKVARVQAWQKAQGRAAANRRALGLELWKQVEPSVKEIGFTAQPLAERRRLSALRVARSLADLEESETIHIRHFEEAMQWSVENFHRLSNWQLDLQH